MSIDVQLILDGKISSLPPGLHLDGFRAVRLHIASAERHLRRGQKEGDETCFTDVVFRCNQAFEGSVKEAYRVLAGSDPKKKTPAEIEQFLSTGNLLRKKVLDQFTRYRQEWRNPSTHDYTLDFDEDEALLAIVTVTVFAIVLCDQIDSKLAFNAASSTSQSIVHTQNQSTPLLDLVAELASAFASSHADEGQAGSSTPHYYYRLEGSLAGYLSAELAANPEMKVTQNMRFGHLEIDILIERGDEKVIIELTSARLGLARHVSQAKQNKVARYIGALKAAGAVILHYSPNIPTYEIRPADGNLKDSVRIISPTSSASD